MISRNNCHLRFLVTPLCPHLLDGTGLQRWLVSEAASSFDCFLDRWHKSDSYMYSNTHVHPFPPVPLSKHGIYTIHPWVRLAVICLSCTEGHRDAINLFENHLFDSILDQGGWIDCFQVVFHQQAGFHIPKMKAKASVQDPGDIR